MSNSNFSANNNFSSIDAEFGLTTNTNNTDKTMNNQTEINMNEATSSQALNLLNNIKSMTITSTSIKDSLDRCAAVPTWEVITDEERALVDAANEIKDGSLEIHKNTWLNFAIVSPNSADFSDKVNLINYRKAEVNRSQLEVEFAKFCMTYKSLDIREGLAVFGITKPNGFSVECVVDFEKGLFNYHAKTTIDGVVVANSRNPKPLAIRKFALVAFHSGNRQAVTTGIYHAEQTFAIFASLIEQCWTVQQFDALIGKMKAKLVVDTRAQAEINNQIAGSNLSGYGTRTKVAANNNSLIDEVSIQTVIESHKIGLIAVCYGDHQYAIVSDNANMTGSEVTIADKVFAPLGLPVHTDKNARKYLVYGNGSLASGLAYNAKGDLVSATPITDATKGANRLASESFLHAINQSADWIGRDADAAEGENLGSALTVALASPGKFARTEGINLPTVFAFSAFNLNNGIIETNAAKQVVFNFEVPKSLSKSISLSEFKADGEVRAKISELITEAYNKFSPVLAADAAKLAIANYLIKQIKEAIKLADGVINASSVMLDGVEVIQNKRDFEMVLDVETLDVRVNNLCLSGHEFEFVINIKAIAPMVGKKSPKLRGNTKKGTAYPTNTQIIGFDNWTTLLTGETVKASKGMLELVANHPMTAELLGVEEGNDLVWDAGTLTIAGVEITQTRLAELISGFGKRVTIIHEVSKAELDSDETLKTVISDANKFSVEAKGDLYLVTERNVLAFESYASYLVELSCADENAGAATLGVNEQYNLAPFDQSLSDKLSKLSKAQVARTKFMNADFEEAATVVDYKDAETISAIAGMLNADNPKQGLMNLAKAYPGGIKFVGEGFEAWCPFSALVEFTHWNGNYPSATMGGSTFWDGDQSEEVITRSLTAQLIELIETLNAGVASDKVRDLFRSMSGVRGFLKSLRSRTHEYIKVGRKTYMADIRKAGKKARKTVIAHHQKVVGDLTIGRSEGLPVVRIHPGNPMDIHVGDVVAISRCPLPMFTICKVELDDSLDKTVVAVNPITWIKSNLGDFDGDTIYITELKRLTEGLNRSQLTDLGVKYNNKYSAVSTHWNIFDKSTSPLTKEFTSYSESDEITKYCDFAVSVNPAVRAANLTKVNAHYAYGVGQFFDVAANLTESLGNKAFNGTELTNAEVLASHRAWIQYEEDGLGGFKPESHEALEAVKTQIATEIANPGSLKPRKVRGRIVGDTSINFLAIQAAAICKVGAEIYDEPTRADIPAESLSAQAFKRLTKKVIHGGEKALWFALYQKVSAESLADTHRFGEQMVALGKIRGNFEEHCEGVASWV